MGGSAVIAAAGGLWGAETGRRRFGEAGRFSLTPGFERYGKAFPFSEDSSFVEAGSVVASAAAAAAAAVAASAGSFLEASEPAALPAPRDSSNRKHFLESADVLEVTREQGSVLVTRGGLGEHRVTGTEAEGVELGRQGRRGGGSRAVGVEFGRQGNGQPSAFPSQAASSYAASSYAAPSHMPLPPSPSSAFAASPGMVQRGRANASPAAPSHVSPSYAAPSQVPLPHSPSPALAAASPGVEQSGTGDISRAGASWADFSRADFSRAAFSRSDFSRADFSREDASEPCRFGLPRQMPVSGSEAAAAAGRSEVAAGRFRSPEEFMRRQLTAMAEAVERGDMVQVQQAYLQLKPLARPKGVAMERIIHYMVDGLFKRVQGTGYQHFSTPVRKTPKELDEARAWFATSTPYPAFGNMAITGMFLDAVSSASHVHLIDFGELLPFHLPTIMELLAARPGGPPHLRVTGLDTTTFVCPGRKDFKNLRAVAEVGRRLRGLAMRLGVPFEFEYIDINENQLHLLYQVKRRWSETLVVCAHLELMNFPDDSVVDHGPRDCILRWIHDLKPALVTIVEMDLDSNARPFLSRFQHVLDHHFSVFSSHDALIGAADKRLLSIFEDLYFGRAAVDLKVASKVNALRDVSGEDTCTSSVQVDSKVNSTVNAKVNAPRDGMELEEAARDRKERLRALREAALIVTTDGETTASRLADGDDGKENEPAAEVRFRSYLPRDDQLMERKLPPAQLPKFQEPTAAQPLFLDPNEDPVTAIAPRKPNWDLRRDVAKRLAKLERCTQRSMIELMREEEERRQQQESGIEGS
ncbi:unnamed protein product [Closterium sp. Naga37s-1]|nr:unnamed protein product [Closterium sp. Naga37s-1]